MKRFTLLWSAFAVGMVAIAIPLRAEQTVRFEAIKNQSTVLVNGTSTAHDWTVKGRTINGDVEFRAAVPPGSSAQVFKKALIENPRVSVSVEIPVSSLRSGKSDMDKKMYDALKRDKHPTITYTLIEAAVEEGNSASDAFLLRTVGHLTIAGETRQLRMPMTVQVLDDNQLTFSGKIAMKMTDFKMKPPQAMLGLIKAGDRVDVRVEWMTARVESAVVQSPQQQTSGQERPGIIASP